MFKNREDQLKGLLDDHAKGEIAVPTELEAIMFDDIMEYIRVKYDHRDGLK